MRLQYGMYGIRYIIQGEQSNGLLLAGSDRQLERWCLSLVVSVVVAEMSGNCLITIVHVHERSEGKIHMLYTQMNTMYTLAHLHFFHNRHTHTQTRARTLY